MTTTDEPRIAVREWPQVAVLRRGLARQLAITPRGLSPLGRQKFEQLVTSRARLDLVDRHLREHEAASGDDPAALLAAAALSEAARLALRDLAEELVDADDAA